MSLTAGSRLGPYEIISPLGTGGMGEVYRAMDTRLGRPVAVKVLADHLADDSQLRRRMEREARAASALNHPSICTIHDVGDEDGRFYIVMECLDGIPLDERLTQGALGHDELQEVACQLAEAIAAAHSSHTVHRDIKPANIFLQTDGPAKILDFGIAKLADRHLGDSPPGDTATTLVASDLTEPGTTLGTFAYMSPEQARGDEVDGRSDLFSLGAVLYEAATGVSPFSRATVGRTLEAVLTEEPAKAASLRAGLPPELDRILNKLLEKDRDLRYQSAADLRTDLARLRRDTGATRSSTAALLPAPVEASSSRYRTALPVLGAVTLAVTAIAALVVFRDRVPDVAPSSEWIQLTDFSDSVAAPSISPDGQFLAYLRSPATFIGEGDVYVQRLPEGEPVRLTDDGGPKMDPHFSPDGNRIAYSVGLARTEVVPVLGGEVSVLLPNSSALTWVTEDEVMFSENRGGLHLAVATSTESRAELRDVYVPASQEGMAHRSYLSPDGRSVLLAEMDNGWQPCRVVPFDGSSLGTHVGPPTAPCTSGAWSPDGEWVYLTVASDGNSHIWRQRFPDGVPEQVTAGPTSENGIAMAPDGKSFVTSVGLARSLLYLNQGSGEELISLEGSTYSPQFSEDGSTLYYLSQRAGNVLELWRLNMKTKRAESVLPGFVVDHSGDSYHVSSDGSQVALLADDIEGRTNVWLAPLDRSSPPRSLTAGMPNGETHDPRFSDIGVFFLQEENGTRRIYLATQNSVEKVSDLATIELSDASTDGRMLLLRMATAAAPAATVGPESGPGGTAIYALKLGAGELSLLCVPCFRALFAPGERALYLQVNNMWIVAPIPPGQTLPDLGPAGLTRDLLEHREDLRIVTGWRAGPFAAAIAPSADSAVFAITRSEVQRNLYQVPLR